MKCIFKRLTAMALLLCTILSFVVPATYADTADEFVVETYDLILADHEDSKIASATSGKYLLYSNCKCKCGKKLYQHIAEMYDEGKLNWCVLATTDTELYYRSDKGNHMRITDKGAWAALKIKVTQSGNFVLKNIVDPATASSTKYLTAYAFPASAIEGADDLNTAIQAQMTDANKLGKKEHDSEGVMTFAEMTYTAGEYVIVMEATGSVYLGALTLSGEVLPEASTATTQAPESTGDTTSETTQATTTETTQATTPEATAQTFHIAVYEDPAYAPMFTNNGALADRAYTKNCYDCGKSIKECLASHYADLNWVLEGTSFKELTFLASDYAENGYGGLRMRYNKETGKEQTGDWVAFRLNVKTPGFYEVTIGKDYPYGYQADMYIFPAEAGTMSSDSLTAAMTGTNKVGKVDIGKNEKTCQAGYKAFDAPGEYILVLKNTGTSERIYINSINLTAVEGEVPTNPPEATEETTETTVPEETEDPGDPTYTQGVYNFALYTEPARKNYFKDGSAFSDLAITKKCADCGKVLKDCIAAEFKADTLNWMLEGTSFGDIRIMAGTAASKGYGGMRLRFDTNENGKVIYITDENGKKSEQESVGNWVAFRVKVNTAGTYTVTVNKNYPAANTNDLYIFPATAEKMSRESLIAAATEANLAGASRITATGLSSEVCDWTFENAGEYIFLLKTNGSTKRMYIDSITLTVPVADQPIPAQKEKIYDFNLPAIDPLLQNAGPTGRYNNSKEVRVDDIIEKMYKADQIQWKYENKSADMSINCFKFTNDSLRFKSKVNVRDLKNQWISFRIENPGTDTYDVRLVSTGASKACVNIYLIPAASEFTVTRAETEAAMTSENLLVKGAIIDDEGTFYLGEYTFGMQEEYILVIEYTKGTFLYMGEVKMTQDGVLADGTVKKQKIYNGTVYDFDMADSMDGVFTKGTVKAPDAMDTLNSLWRSGKLNWKWENASTELLGNTKATATQLSDLTRFYRATGMRIFSKVNYWSAFRIKSPGSGTFTLSLNHAVSNYSGTLAVYILPGDTEDIEAAMDHSNRAGLVALYNDGSSGTKDGYHSYIGYWDFEAGKEYIIVLEAYETSPYSTYCYMNISQMIAQRGKIDFESDEEKKVKAVTVVNNVVPSADPGGNCLVTEIGGHDYYFLPLEGGSMLVYDLDTRELIDKISTGYAKCYGIDQAPDGTIWLSGDNKYLIHYDPLTGKATRTTRFTEVPGLEGSTGSRGLYVHDDGIIYFGTYHDAQFASYNPEAQEYTVYGDIVPNLDRIMGIIHHDGYLYMSAYDNGSDRSYIGKFEIATGKVVASCSVEEVAGTGMNYLRMLGDGDLIVGGYSGATRAVVAVDPKTMQLVDTGLPAAGINQNATEEINGKHYLVLSNNYGMYQYDVATKEFSIVPGMTSIAGIGFKMPTNVVTIEGKTLLMTNSTSSGGAPRFYDLEAKEVTNWLDLVVHGDGGADILNIANGPEGSNEIHIGVFNVSQSGLYNTETNEFLGRYKTGGQGDSAIYYEGKLYYGNYSSTTLNEIYIDQENLQAATPNNEVIRRWKLDHEETGQKRVHSLAAGDGYVFAGTIPDTGEFGGAIVVYDTRTGRWYYERNVVQDQAVKSVAYSDHILYGGTTIQGGTSTTEEPRAKSAVIFAYDYENRELLGVLDPREHISGFTSSLDYVAGVEADPVVEGRMWAVVSETLIAFTFDKETRKFNVQTVISFSKGAAVTSSNRSLQDRNILFDVERSKIYFSFDTKGGMQCLDIEDFNAPLGSLKVTNNENIMSAKPMDYALSEQGDLYYGSGGNLMMLPLNVTEDEWAIAGSVDAMITAVEEPVTLEKETAIKEARSAYDNLSPRYKALIQELERLRELEVDLLECKIDAVELEKVDADSLPALQELVDTYDGMTARYKKYVKNYEALQEAYIKANTLNDQRLAAALQKKIDALKDRFPLTLDDEPDVLALRAEYDAMTVGQRVLVDTAILEDAEAQIAALREDLVKYVDELIKAIPEKITLEAEPAITLAREYADKLYVNERKQVPYTKLTSAEGKLRTLQKAKTAAEEVDALIDAIGIVTLSDKTRIAEARDAYDALNETALAFLQNGKKLETAETILKILQTWGIPAITVFNICIVVLLVPGLRKKVFNGKKKEAEAEEKA